MGCGYTKPSAEASQPQLNVIPTRTQPELTPDGDEGSLENNKGLLIAAVLADEPATPPALAPAAALLAPTEPCRLAHPIVERQSSETSGVELQLTQSSDAPTMSVVTTAVVAPAPDAENKPMPDTESKPPLTRPPLTPREKALAPEMVAKWDAEMQFTEEQNLGYAEFRSRLEKEGVLAPYWDNKPTFYQFMQARQNNVEKAFAMFSAHIQWRKEWNLEVHNTWDIPALLKPENFTFPEKSKIKDAHNFIHHKQDHTGRLIYIDRPGSLDFKALSAATTQDSLLKSYVWDCEATMAYRLPGCSLAANKYVGKTLTIIDLAGFTVSSFDSKQRAYLKLIAKLSSDNYPELLGKMFVINAPFVFRGVWNVVRTFVDQRTQKKIGIYGGKSDYLPKLLEYVSLEDLPDFIGGKDTSCDFKQEKGPWADILPDIIGVEAI